MGPGAVTDAGPSPRADGSSRRAPWPARLALGCGILASGAVAAGIGSSLLTGWTGLTVGQLLGEAVWLAAAVVGLTVGSVLLRRLPANPMSWAFAVVVGTTSTGSLLDYLHTIGVDRGAGTGVLVLVVWLGQTLVLGASAAAVFIVATFPDGVVQRWWEGAVVRLAVLLLVLPTVLLVVNPVLTTRWWADVPDVASPFHVPALAVSPERASVALEVANLVLLPAAAALTARYRRSGSARRARMRWILVPIVLAGVGTVSAALLQPPALLVSVLVIGLQVALYLAVAFALLEPRGVDPDRVLRRSLVYGVLWLSITGVWALASALVGVTAGRASVGWAVLITVLAAALFQPARRRLEGLADRWVFGRRPDPSGAIARLGSTLATTYDLESVLPRMADTLREGLALDWADVTLDPGEGGPRTAPAGESDHAEALLVVPIVLEGETLGEVRCGPRRSGPLTADEADLVVAFAHQAALAVRNVRLTHELANHATELAASRTRLVRAQEAERRRIERNIHDGVQQDLVALISQAGRAQRVLGREPSVAERELATLQDGLHRVLADLRELARGIHPSLLTDRGLLVAVEALAARSPVPTRVRADPSLRDERLPEELEVTAYFTVAEALANTLKHAGASHLDVTLARRDGSLHVEVSDDGCGMEPAAGALSTVAERVAALGGDLTVSSSPGHGTTVSTRLSVEAPT